MLLAQVYARVYMCVRKLIMKVLAIVKTFSGNIITFFNITVCFGIKSADSEETQFEVAGITRNCT